MHLPSRIRECFYFPYEPNCRFHGGSGCTSGFVPASQLFRMKSNRNGWQTERRFASACPAALSVSQHFPSFYVSFVVSIVYHYPKKIAINDTAVFTKKLRLPNPVFYRVFPQNCRKITALYALFTQILPIFIHLQFYPPATPALLSTAQILSFRRVHCAFGAYTCSANRALCGRFGWQNCGHAAAALQFFLAIVAKVHPIVPLTASSGFGNSRPEARLVLDTPLHFMVW